MANQLYAKARKRALNAGIGWESGTIKAVLVDTDFYSVDLATHEFLSDVPVGARASISAALTGKTSEDGVADADNAVFALVPAGPACEAVVIFSDTGNPATSPLIGYCDVAVNLPATPVSGDINVSWGNGVDRIFKL